MNAHPFAGALAAVALILALLAFVLPARAEKSKALAIPLLITFITALFVHLATG